MDFFARQDRARRLTHILVIYFAVAVVLIVVALNLVATAVVNLSASYQRTVTPVFDAYGHPVAATAHRVGLWQPDVFAYVTVGALIVIAAGSLYKIGQLSGGGRAVAGMMGAIPVAPNAPDPAQRQLCNVVQEMSIASGVPAPAVFLLPRERGINAFAAGFNTRDAVICVTQGALEQLTRDELQGVIAHEFSHILNGDMNLDLRLVGALHGILLIGLIGWGLVRAAGSDNSSSDQNIGWTLALLAIGVVLMTVGFVGLFFGRLIQSAVCRQREFLADAAAVQFTRNPGGLASALKKLGAMGFGSRVGDHSAEQIAHMFFASSLGAEWGWFATHPPLAQRIRLIDPSWDGKFSPHPGPTTLERYGGVQTSTAAPGMPLSAAGIVGAVGSPMPRHIQWASDFLTSIPPVIDQAARDPFAARALVFALLLADPGPVREKQIELLARQTDAATLNEVSRLAGPVEALGARARRVLVDLALPALRHLSGPQIQQFTTIVQVLTDADGGVSLFEYMLRRILARYLIAPAPKAPASAYYAIQPLLGDVEVILSALAQADGKDDEAVTAAFSAGVACLETPEALRLRKPVAIPAIDAALDHLALAAPGVKRRIVNACAYCVAADGMVQTGEGELLRAITTGLECPLPPLLAQHVQFPQPASVAT